AMAASTAAAAALASSRLAAAKRRRGFSVNAARRWAISWSIRANDAPPLSNAAATALPRLPAAPVMNAVLPSKLILGRRRVFAPRPVRPHHVRRHLGLAWVPRLAEHA